MFHIRQSSIVSDTDFDDIFCMLVIWLMVINIFSLKSWRPSFFVDVGTYLFLLVRWPVIVTCHKHSKLSPSTIQGGGFFLYYVKIVTDFLIRPTGHEVGPLNFSS